MQLDGFRQKTEGLCHISQLRNERVKAVADVLSRGERVKVKVLKMENGKMSLTIKEVNQQTGEDLNPAEAPLAEDALLPLDERRGGGDAPWMNPERETAASAAAAAKQAASTARSRVRLSTPERWELHQLKSAGAISYADMPDFDEEMGILKNEGKLLPYQALNADISTYLDESDGEDFEIELVEDNATFLRGYGKAVQDLEPVKVVKNPDGSLAQAAIMQSALSKERRETKQQVQREKDGGRPRGSAPATGSRLLDPMAANPNRNYEDEEPATWTNARNRDKDMPEWMKHVTAGGKATFGKRTTLSIKEQRETLPIFNLKEALMQAIDDNQVSSFKT